ncbi:6454_t:CDS:1, partial [Rhizophagus irregularis]
KYNLRSNKQARVSADDSETFPPMDEDTDLYDDAVMSDGAVFKRIIQPDTDNHISEKQFSVKSYNPLNLLPSFNALTSR